MGNPPILTKTVKVALVHPDPDQPRKVFDETKLAELADSIKTRGLLQPITVRLVSGKPVRYQIVTGERRWRAHQIAGISLIQVQLTGFNRTSFIDQIIENDQRDDMTPLDRARAYRRCLDEGLVKTPGELAEQLGLRQPFRVNEALMLLKLIPEAQDRLEQGRLSQARAWSLTGVRPEHQADVLALEDSGKLITDALFAAACEKVGKPKNDVVVNPLLQVEQRSAAVTAAIRTIEQAGMTLGPLLDCDELQGLSLMDAGAVGEKLKFLAKTVADLRKKVERNAEVS